MEGKLKIGVIVGMAFVAGIIGTLSFASFDNQTNEIVSQINPNVQTLGIGANVIIKAYHDDGSLFYEEEVHNSLHYAGRNLLVSCLTGFDTTPTSFNRCSPVVNATQLRGINHTDQSLVGGLTSWANVALHPIGCDTDGGFSTHCSAFNVTNIYDFDTLDCTANVNCFNVTDVLAGFSPDDSSFSPFNKVTTGDQIPIAPFDRLQVAMNFDIP